VVLVEVVEPVRRHGSTAELLCARLG
jgi:hypothetical protein